MASTVGSDNPTMPIHTLEMLRTQQPLNPTMSIHTLEILRTQHLLSPTMSIHTLEMLRTQPLLSPTMSIHTLEMLRTQQLLIPGNLGCFTSPSLVTRMVLPPHWKARTSGGSRTSGQYRHNQKRMKMLGYCLLVSWSSLYMNCSRKFYTVLLNYGHHGSVSTENCSVILSLHNFKTNVSFKCIQENRYICLDLG